MTFSREQLRTTILYDFLCGLIEQLCIDRLHLAVGDKAPSNTIVYHWFLEFERGCRNLSDEFCEGRSLPLLSPQTVMP